MFVMWIGEQVTERGIGNGISLIIMAGIVARLPSALWTTFQFVREGEMSLFVLILILLIVFGVTGFIVYVETRPAPDSGSVRAARGRTASIWRAEFALAAQDKYRRSDPADLRLVDPGFSGNRGDLSAGGQESIRRC